MTRLREAVAASGWVVVDGPGDAASTAGLTARGLPELVVLGLPAETGGALLHALGTRLAAGERLVDGEPVPGLLDGPPPVLVRVTAPVPAPATELYDDVVLRQLVWPDAEGRYPWHAGFAHDQPVLGPPPPPPVSLAEAGTALPSWPLAEDPHTPVLTARPVAAGAPALLVLRDDDGGLRLLDGESDFDPSAAVEECLHDAVDRDPSLVAAVAAVEPGQAAERDAAGDPWTVADW
ncbi:MAG TPA: DUF4262 domain-containing protein [Mycobacteriales bacterium]|nr:DUF4262 domain-containing protein [Mycobacteriales bacterium]